ncbi:MULTISPECIES: hypothetical protein [Pseudomonas]|uniref:EamA domain-containing protein n=1 Tax=Pseudomonas gessardii TaxID=78544 RepID=A0A7Y1MN96_9PSED|nr:MULTISPECIES: hypothetical protein [Pseudomonas]MBH3421678.1 hypothetical protein [Pseudomonas gessardii]MCF4978769.1 hypothetical protein [Pseudomonas gessardii]MCF5083926.1 hypothetical protein [Pseudomonas gessardii]MCF5094416.1 hypothetical protein [Pseudomonas gessardii]MCF5108167.1 hypothetical protein [Pseudomonas gessardii]
MKSSHYLILSMVLMIFGEVLTIYSEVYASKLSTRAIENPELFIKPILLICAAGISLIFAYWLGYQATGNIWIVTVVSLTLLLILEPIVIYAMLGEFPGRGALVGFILGGAGLLATLVL